jgi:hypothetical protein
MKCSDVRAALLREAELGPEARAHLARCEGCRETASLLQALARDGGRRRECDLPETAIANTRRQAHGVLTETDGEAGLVGFPADQRVRRFPHISDLILGWRPAAAFAVPVAVLLIGIVAILRSGEITTVEPSLRTREWEYATRRVAIDAQLHGMRRGPRPLRVTPFSGQSGRLRARIALYASEISKELEGIPDTPTGDPDSGGGSSGGGHSLPSTEGELHENPQFKMHDPSGVAMAAIARALSVCTLWPAELHLPCSGIAGRGTE